MTSISSGDVVVCRFPFTDGSGAKARPAVVVSSAAFHRRRGDLIIGICALGALSRFSRVCAFCAHPKTMENRVRAPVART